MSWRKQEKILSKLIWKKNFKIIYSNEYVFKSDKQRRKWWSNQESYIVSSMKSKW